MNRFLVTEPDNCIGCRTCEVACVLAHQGEGKTVVKKESFMPRLKVVVGRETTTTVQCRHCDDAPCVSVCPTNALVFGKNSVQFVDEKCIGCKTCVIACPYGAIDLVAKPMQRPIIGGVSVKSRQYQAHKCDLCTDSNTGPACVQSCPTKAIRLVEPALAENVNYAKR